MVIATLALALGQTLYTDHGNPTAAEQRVLEIINRARANPSAEGARLGINITEGLQSPPGPDEVGDVGPRPPLAMNGKLLAAARAHSVDMWTRAFFAHTNPDGTSFSDRMTAAGYAWFGAAENIAMRTTGSAEILEDDLMIDAGYAGRGHRKTLLDINPSSSTYYREIGIGFYRAPSGVLMPAVHPTAQWRDFLTQDFGRSATLPFLLGVAYLDTNGNLFYDEGEELGGVAVTPSSGSFRALTSFAGGYAFPTAATGGINLTFSSTSIPADVVVAVTLTSANQKVDLRIPAQADGDGDGLPDFWESRFGGALAPGVDTDGDTFSNLLEFRGGSSPLSAASTPAPPPPPPSPPAGGSSDDDKGGTCGATGLDGLAAAILASLLFRGRRRV